MNQQLGLHRGGGIGHRPLHQPADHRAACHFLFVGAVVDQLRVRPDQGQAAGDYSVKWLAGRNPLCIVKPVRLQLLALFFRYLSMLG